MSSIRRLLLWPLGRNAKLPFILNPMLTEDDIVKGALPRVVHTSSVSSSRRDTGHNSEAELHHGPSQSEEVILQRYHSTTTSECFYDLFFATNLSAFTASHPITTGPALLSYCGFFAILWFTWLQVSLFDLRFHRDSVFDRLSKVTQFGVMVAFILIGSDFDPDSGTINGYLFSLVLMVGRLITTVQYLVVLVFMWRLKSIRLPLVITAGIYCIASMCYLGIAFAFPPSGNAPLAYVGWYAIAVMESICAIAVSVRWRGLGFKGTHIEERFSLLTTIILGEGLIGIGQALQVCSGFYDDWATPSFLGDVVAGLIILYCLYMIYFDSLPSTHIGTIRQQIWAAFHLPLNLALVLNVEGLAQSILWQGTTRAIKQLTDSLHDIALCRSVFTNDMEMVSAFSSNDTAMRENAVQLGRVAYDAVDRFWGGASGPDLVNHIDGIVEGLSRSANQSVDAISAQVYDIANHLFDTMYSAFGIQAPVQTRATSNPDFDYVGSYLDVYSNLFLLIFTYFFVSCGCNIILQGILRCLNVPKGGRLSRWDKCCIATYFVAGLAEALLALLVLSPAITDFTDSPWLIVTVAIIAIGLVVITNI